MTNRPQFGNHLTHLAKIGDSFQELSPKSLWKRRKCEAQEVSSFVWFDKSSVEFMTVYIAVNFIGC